MGNYNRNDRSGGRGRGGGDFRRGRDSGPREMHKAVCDECGRNCEVPFRPSGDKPIYCSNCFERKEGGNSRGSGRQDRGSFRRPSFEKKDNTNKQLLEGIGSLNTKLDRILAVIESNVEKKPAPKKSEAQKIVKKSVPKPKDKKVSPKKAGKKK